MGCGEAPVNLPIYRISSVFQEPKAVLQFCLIGNPATQTGSPHWGGLDLGHI